MRSSAPEAFRGLDPFQIDRLDSFTPLTFGAKDYRARSICSSHVGYGPLDAPSQAPASPLRLTLAPRTPSTLLRGQVELRWRETITNFWAYEADRYRLDYGATFSRLGMLYGLADEVQVELELIDFRRHDSVLDDITNLFHSAFGLSDADRDDFPEHENVIFFDSPGGGPDLLSENESTYSQDLALTFQHSVTCGTQSLPAFSYAATLRTNVAGNIQLDGGTDLSGGLTVSAAWRFGDRWYGYLSLGWMRHGLDRWRGLALVKEQTSQLVVLEYRYAPRAAWVLQYLRTDAISKDLAPFDRATHEIMLGWKREFSPGTLFEFGILENAVVFDNSPDIGFHLGLSHRF